MQHPPLFITLTGIDDRTDLDRVVRLSETYAVEWAVLFSPDRQGIDNRFPTQETIERFRSLPVLKSAHLCGDYAADVMSGAPCRVDLTGFQRAQINHRKPDFEAIREFGVEHTVGVIAQHRTLIYPDSDGVELLFDRSGGKGETPKEWPQHPGRRVGYAGGITPDNIKDILNAIDSRGDYWLDMESGVRTDDWLDLDKCETVLRYASV
jgi:hypothetical protein